MIKKIFFSAVISATIVACSTNAVTGRKQFKLVPESELQNGQVEFSLRAN